MGGTSALQQDLRFHLIPGDLHRSHTGHDNTSPVATSHPHPACLPISSPNKMNLGHGSAQPGPQAWRERGRSKFTSHKATGSRRIHPLPMSHDGSNGALQDHPSLPALMCCVTNISALNYLKPGQHPQHSTVSSHLLSKATKRGGRGILGVV